MEPEFSLSRARLRYDIAPMAPKHASATAKPPWTLLCIDKRVLAEGSRGPLRDAPVRPLK